MCRGRVQVDPDPGGPGGAYPGRICPLRPCAAKAQARVLILDRIRPLLLPWQPSCRRQEAPTAGKVAQPRSARALPRPPTGPLLPPPQAPVAAQGSPGGQSWRLGGSRHHPGRTGAAAPRAPPDARRAGAGTYTERRCEKKK